MPIIAAKTESLSPQSRFWLLMMGFGNYYLLGVQSRTQLTIPARISEFVR